MFSPVLLSLALLGCKSDEIPDIQPASYDLSRFSDCGELRSYVTQAWVETLVQSWYGGGMLDAEAGGDDGSGGGEPEYSGTNVQELGVDEPDLVKTDGSFMYVAHGTELSVMRSWPVDDVALLATLDLEGVPQSLLLRGDRLLVFSPVWAYGEGGVEGDWDEGTGTVPDWTSAEEDDYSWDYSTRLSVIDVSEPTAPEVLREIDLEGWYVDARMIDGDVYVVTDTWSTMPNAAWELLWDGTLTLPEPDWEASEAVRELQAAAARGILTPTVSAMVEDLPIEALLTEFRDQVPGEEADPELLVQCGDTYHPAGISSPSVLTLSHLDLDEEDGPISATSLMADGWEVYASADRLYVSQTSGWWSWGWDSEDEGLQTHVHAFDLSGPDTVYAASGKVPGWLLNRWSMSEYDGYLRIATTDMGWWTEDEGEDPANAVRVLGQVGDELVTVGEVGGIAPNEQIYSARFMGDIGFLVTFEQVDPLFTLDLSDPTAPAVVGELEVSGYSSYLHPAGEEHLLAVGMEATEDGAIEGFQISLFDISDLSAPTLADRLLLESDDWSWSESLWDAHAFTYWRDTLAVPVYTWDYDSGDGFQGLLVSDVDLDRGALSELGRVDHDDIVAASTCPDDPWDDCWEDDMAWMRRSVGIEDTLFSISNYGVKVVDLRDPSVELASVGWYAD